MKQIVFIFLFCIYSAKIYSQQGFQRIDSLLDAGVDQHYFSGTVLIKKGNKIVYEKSVGFADYKTQKAFTPTTTFQIASVSKQFTAFGIMVLYKNGKLNYNDFVTKYLPNFPYDNITIRHLLNHSSGLPDFWSLIRPNMNLAISNGNNEMLQYLVDHKLALQFTPGSKWAYADIGYDLLATIIEKISGKTYEAFMHKYVFKPAKLKHTKALQITDIRRINEPNQAFGHSYIVDSNKMEYTHLLKAHDYVFYLGNFYGDGSVISTARDLARWDKVLRKNKLMPEALMKEAYSPAKDTRDSLLYSIGAKPTQRMYGFGWGITNKPNLGVCYSHSGGHPGFTTFYNRYPNKKIVVVITSNIHSNTNLGKLRDIIFEEVDLLYK